MPSTWHQEYKPQAPPDHTLACPNHISCSTTVSSSNTAPCFTSLPRGTYDAYNAMTGPNLIGNDDNKSIANIFCFGAFADKNSGIVYHNLTGLFPFMSYDKSVCFFILYHYKSNSILASPIAGLDNVNIYSAYKTQI
jgi:hypothetical protein